jgi:tetratricopeptide (TPR) repeat protein
MRKGFIYLFLLAPAVFQFGCGQPATSNNSNSSATTTVTETQSNANIKVEDTPLPTFTDADSALAAGKKLLDENKTEKSVEAFKQAIQLNPELADAHFNLGIALALLEKEQEDSQPATEETPSATPKNKKGKKEEIKLTPSQKSFEKAAEIYEKVTKQDPQNDVAFFNLGRSYNKLNKDEEAEKAFRQAAKLKPDDADYQFELGQILSKLSHYDEAIVALKKARSLDPDNLQIPDELEKAQAGQQRINYGANKLKSQDQTQAGQKTKSNSNANPGQRPTPPLRIEEVPLPKSSPKN